jgi:hypothetical protein
MTPKTPAAGADDLSALSEGGFAVFRECRAGDLPGALVAAQPLFAAARAAGLDVALVVSRSEDASRRVGVKRRHDVKGALRTLEYALDALQRGESLAPTEGTPAGASKIDAVARAVAILKRECPELLDAAFPP